MIQTQKGVFPRAMVGLAILMIAAGLKYHYSRATSDDLEWILAPTAQLVEWLSDISFQKETGSGYVNHQRRLIIAPSCAGINFMIITFCMMAFSGLAKMDRGYAGQLWGVFSLAFAYGYTIAVNAVRIAFSVILFEADIYSRWLTSARAHRLEGIFVYFLFLSLAYFVVQKLLKSIPSEKRYPLESSGRWSVDARGMLLSGSIPVLWYLAVTLGVPLINSAHLDGGSRFSEHILTVLLICVVVFLFLFLIRLGCHLTICRYLPAIFAGKKEPLKEPVN